MISIMRQKFSEWLLCRNAARRLQGLDDRLLADMGTRREDIDCFVQGCRSVGAEEDLDGRQSPARQRSTEPRVIAGMLSS